jgi:hypothetical protein
MLGIWTWVILSFCYKVSIWDVSLVLLASVEQQLLLSCVYTIYLSSRTSNIFPWLIDVVSAMSTDYIPVLLIRDVTARRDTGWDENECTEVTSLF